MSAPTLPNYPLGATAEYCRRTIDAYDHDLHFLYRIGAAEALLCIVAQGFLVVELVGYARGALPYWYSYLWTVAWTWMLVRYLRDIFRTGQLVRKLRYNRRLFTHWLQQLEAEHVSGLTMLSHSPHHPTDPPCP